MKNNLTYHLSAKKTSLFKLNIDKNITYFNELIMRYDPDNF